MNKTSKRLLILCAVLLASTLVFAGGKKEKKIEQIEESSESQLVSEPEVVTVESEEVNPVEEKKEDFNLRIGILNGPTSIPTAYLVDDVTRIENTKASFEIFASPAAVLPKMIKGEIDIGFMPINVAAKAYNSTNGAILFAGVCGNGNITLITRDATVLSFADLKGKKVTVAGQGATPDYMFRYLLAQNDIAVGTDPESVEIIYAASTQNIVPELLSGKIAYAVIPEPFSTIAVMKDTSVRRAFDFQREFEKSAGIPEGVSYPLSVIVVSKKYATENAEKVNSFLNSFETSVDWTVKNPQKAGVLVQKHTLGLMAPIVGKSIPNCDFVYENAISARPRIESLLNIFLTLDPQSIGGKLPDDGFYFN